jgi:hypothetical protein
VSLIVLSFALTGAGERLTWEARRKHSNLSDTCALNDFIAANISDISKGFAIGKVPVIHGAGEGFDFGVGERCKTMFPKSFLLPSASPFG